MIRGLDNWYCRNYSLRKYKRSHTQVHLWVFEWLNSRSSEITGVYLPGRRRMSRTWPTSEGTRENLRQESRGRSSRSCGPYTSSGLEVGRLVTVDHEAGLVRIVHGWEKGTSYWMAKVYPTHDEVLASTARSGRVKSTRVSRESLQRASLREGVVPLVTAILQGIPGILRGVSGTSGPSTRR